jgi:hypothetical protein
MIIATLNAAAHWMDSSPRTSFLSEASILGFGRGIIGNLWAVLLPDPNVSIFHSLVSQVVSPECAAGGGDTLCVAGVILAAIAAVSPHRVRAWRRWRPCVLNNPAGGYNRPNLDSYYEGYSQKREPAGRRPNRANGGHIRTIA